MKPEAKNEGMNETFNERYTSNDPAMVFDVVSVVVTLLKKM